MIYDCSVSQIRNNINNNENVECENNNTRSRCWSEIDRVIEIVGIQIIKEQSGGLEYEWLIVNGSMSIQR